MRLNWLAYNYREYDGYGRYSNRMIQALKKSGVQVAPLLAESVNMPAWMSEQLAIDWQAMTISCLPPCYLLPAPGRHWLLSMTEGSVLPAGWADWINASGVERVIVPCAHNAATFAEGGVNAPISIIPGGTAPDEFPLRSERSERPYTFLCLADRGARKGWVEVWDAFYKAFLGPLDTPDVRLIIKCRPDGNELVSLIAGAKNRDPRIEIIQADLDMRDFYAMGDCLAMPSRSEGWGMPHREAAMQGLPVITQRYAGLDDGFTDYWSLVVEEGRLEAIPDHFEHIAGCWRRASTSELADWLRWCYDEPVRARSAGQQAHDWLASHQTWDHSAALLLELLGAQNGLNG